MTTINQHCRKFQELLRELFQFDCADLDFGIYRIMNYKRDVLEKFISEDLPGFVGKELESGDLAEQSEIADELEKVTGRIREALGPDAIGYDGNLSDVYHETPLGRKYRKIKARATGIRSREALEAAIFNNLYAFFSRYYQDGDFVSKRRYSKRQRYAVPYNGEEFLLHWANRDQYYVKNAEHFHDYSFTSHGVAVHFKLRAASVEQNNVKGGKRFFLPIVKEVACDDKAKRVVIPFEYRPLSVREESVYHGRNQQTSIITEALAEIPKRLKKHELALLALAAEREKSGDGESVSFLEHHLLQYTRRNTSDFFIHKNLKEFLSRELDFYLKNEVLNLDELEAAGEHRAEGWFQVMRAIKSVGGRIIDFLDQIERFQKMLWEKRKFIVETQYCVTVGKIDESLYSDIAACESQWMEWRELLHIDEQEVHLFNSNKDGNGRRVAFLKTHPTLILDTRHFDTDFVDGLLGGMENLDDEIEGVLIHSDNFQAINLLLGKYRERITCVHIDPPYNTHTGGFLYKNSYQHSSWLTMMENRISCGVPLLTDNGSLLCHIDENEHERLHLLLDYVGIPNAGTVVWDKRNPMTGGGGIAVQHEYVLWRKKSYDAINLRNENIQSILEKAKELVRKHGVEEARKKFSGWVRRNKELSGGEKAYCNIDDSGRVYRGVSLRAPEPRTDPKFFEPLLHPATGKPCPVPPNGFSRTPDNLRAMIERGEILFGPDETTQPQQKRFLTKESKRQLTSVLCNAKKGKSDLDSLGLDNFPYCHSVSFYAQLLGAATSGTDDLVIDYFSGSGTSAHAVINLNREDGGTRKFILVEMDHCFDSVMLPRIKKVVFAPDWSKGKPNPVPSGEESGHTPGIFKYLRLESYEDALNNIEYESSSKQRALKFEDYLLKYMLMWETRSSETFLNAEKLSLPFGYKLRIHSNGQTREKTADIPETFNYLMGIHVQKRQVYDDDGRRYLVYRGLIDKRQVAVVWRETEGWEQTDLERDKEFVAESKFVEGAEEIFVNGDSFIPNAKSLEPAFKSRMFAPVET